MTAGSTLVHPYRLRIWFPFPEHMTTGFMVEEEGGMALGWENNSINHIWTRRVKFFHRAPRLKKLETGLSRKSQSQAERRESLKQGMSPLLVSGHPIASYLTYH